MEIGPKLGYNPQPAKSWLIIKNNKVAEAKEHFRETQIQLTTTGERHLGAVIGNEEFKAIYCKKLVEKWTKEIKLQSEIALTEPQSVYTCYTSGYQSKFT